LLLLERKGIKHHYFDGGNGLAGSIEVTQPPPERTRMRTKDAKRKKAEKPSEYLMRLNKNHEPNVQFSTLAHELGHLFLGHLGSDERLSIPVRPMPMNHAQMELEAESFAYLACRRNGVQCKSESYLADYVKQHTNIESLDIYQVLRAVGQMELMLKLTAHTRYERPKIKR